MLNLIRLELLLGLDQLRVGVGLRWVYLRLIDRMRIMMVEIEDLVGIRSVLHVIVHKVRLLLQKV